MTSPAPCPRCRGDSPAGSRFCQGCGAPLAEACPACGHELPPAARFCNQCGQPVAALPPPAGFASPGAYTPRHLADRILTSRGALEGERKQVSILFVDVSGFTSMSEQLDPEVVHGLMTRAFELMLAEVHRFEGTVNQFLGDGIMALFGAPIAHEDHARRGVSAALGIRQALEQHQADLMRERGLRFQVRQGLNTGLVVVGSIGNDLRMDYTAIGDTTNVAARLMQAAEPGMIVISEPVQRLAEGFFELRPLGPLSLKGKAEPVRAWSVLAARVGRSRLDVEAERGLTSLVGRERELAVLAECFEKAASGRGQMVSLIGEPGIGKSRLVYELGRRLGDRAAWREGRCLSYGHAQPLHPLVNLLRRGFGLEGGEEEATAAVRIESGVLGLGHDLRPVLPYVRYLLGVAPADPAVASLDPQERRGQLFHALQGLLLRAAEVAPQVMVFEDLHWTDGTTEEYLALVADSLPTSRVLLLLTYRTGYAPPFGERTYHTRLVLGPLSPKQSAAMAHAMLPTGAGDARALVVARAEGNPFFVEEMVKSLREAPEAAAVDVPNTVLDVIAARIDRLAEEPKRVLQAAAVIGRDFSLRLLDRVMTPARAGEAAVRTLVGLELIYPRRVFPEAEYTFKHALTQEVAYRSLLVQRRQDYHRRIAGALEELYGDRLPEHYAVLVHHYRAAEAWDRALEYVLKAAAAASRAFATRDALGLYDEAAAVAMRLGAAVPVVALMAARRGRAEQLVLVSEFDRARAEWEQAAALARAHGDRQAEGAALVAMGQASWLGHRFEQALDDSRRAAALAEAIGDTAVLAGSQLNAAIVYEVTGRLDEARERFGRAIALSRPAGAVANEAMALVFGAELESWEGHYARAEQLYEDGIRLGRQHNVLVAVLEGLFMSGINLTGQGAHDRALAAFEEGLALAERVGDENYTPRYLNSLGWLHIECGDLAAARALNERAAVGAGRRGDHESLANAVLNLGDIALLKGDLAGASDHLEDVRRLVANPATSEWMRWRYTIHLFASLGELALAAGDLRAARGHADECLEQAARTRSRKYLVKGWRLRGEIARAAGRKDEAETALHEALAMATAIGNPAQLWTTHVALARLAADGRRDDLARRHWVEARAVTERTQAAMAHPGLRASLAASPLVREIAVRAREG